MTKYATARAILVDEGGFRRYFGDKTVLRSEEIAADTQAVRVIYWVAENGADGIEVEANELPMSIMGISQAEGVRRAIRQLQVWAKGKGADLITRVRAEAFAKDTSSSERGHAVDAPQPPMTDEPVGEVESAPSEPES